MKDSESGGVTETSPLGNLELVCGAIFDQWDRDMRSGKLLSALSGLVENYDPRVTSVRKPLASQPDLLTATIEQGKLIEAAQAILTEYLVPDGIDAAECIGRLLGHFDGPEQRRIKAMADAAIAKAGGATPSPNGKIHLRSAAEEG